MNKIKNIFKYAIGLSFFILAGCSDDFLDRPPLNSITPATFYKTDQDARQATNGIYAMLADMPWEGYSLAKPALQEVDNLIATWAIAPHYGTQTPLDGTVKNTWYWDYVGIERSNEVIYNVGNSETISPSVKDISLGHAHFLRAFFYFEVVRYWGDVPLITLPTGKSDMFPARAPKEEVFALILSDLQNAIEKLPSKGEAGYEKGKVTKETAQLLYAQVNLWLASPGGGSGASKLDAAIENARAVINSGKYTLLDNYADVFKEEPKNNDESLFEVQYLNGVYNNWHDLFFGPQQLGTSWNTGWPLKVFTQDYKGGELRRKASIIAPGETFTRRDGTTFVQDDDNMVPINGGYGHIKYISGTKQGFAANGHDLHILRLAHAHYILSEALARKNNGPTPESYSLINDKIRPRAGLPPIPSGLGLNEFLDTLISDRRYEFYFEFERRFELLRTGKLIETMNNALQVEGVTNRFTTKDLLMPIPQQELDVNKNLTQNPGY
jgi:hypothetical protein